MGMGITMTRNYPLTIYPLTIMNQLSWFGQMIKLIRFKVYGHLIGLECLYWASTGVSGETKATGWSLGFSPCLITRSQFLSMTTFFHTWIQAYIHSHPHSHLHSHLHRFPPLLILLRPGKTLHQFKSIQTLP